MQDASEFRTKSGLSIRTEKISAFSLESIGSRELPRETLLSSLLLAVLTLKCNNLYDIHTTACCDGINMSKSCAQEDFD
jgi:hypothetical protein